MEYVLYGEDRHHWSNALMHRDVDWKPQSYSTCQLRKEELGVGTHCKVESWSANWWQIARCYGLVISCMSRPFRSFCRYQVHSLRVHLCRIQGRQRSRQPQHQLNFLFSFISLCKNVLLVTFTSIAYYVKLRVSVQIVYHRLKWENLLSAFYRATLGVSAVQAIGRCLSVCHTRVICV